MKSWIDASDNTDFSIYNLPFGIFSVGNGPKKVGSAIGNYVIDLSAAHQIGVFDGVNIDPSVLVSTFLNDFIGQGKQITNEVRLRLQKELTSEDSALKGSASLIPMSDVKMHLPVRVGDYTDFYSSIEHATNVGMMFRDPENALLPNWKHLPVGYHGRASSIIPSGVDIKRPKGQTKPNDGPPVFGPSQRMDFELEMGFVIGKDSQLGDTVSTSDANDYIFGLALFNDWSARDIQKWEYVPLGPFLGKNFASSISCWIVTLEALQPFSVAGPNQDPEVLPYLKYDGNQNYDIKLEVTLQPENGSEEVISKSNFKYMYWNMCQQLAHHTVNGCNVKVGDIMASGTISGKDASSYGSMLEIAWAGKKPLTLLDGSERKFIKDGDKITIRGHAQKGEMRVGFGEVSAKILPAD